MKVSSSEINERIRLAIKLIVPYEETEFSRIMEYVFEPYSGCINYFSENGVFPDRILDAAPFVLAMKERLCIEITSHPEFDTSTYAEYFNKIYSLILADVFGDKNIPAFIKAIAAKNTINVIEDNKIVLENDREQKQLLTQFFTDQITGFQNSDTEIKTLNDLNEFVKQEIRQEPYLFDIDLIEQLDLKLRGEFINDESPALSSIFHREQWINNEIKINWEKSRYSLLHLLYLLNNHKTKIYKGTIIILAAKCFTIKGKIMDKERLQKSFSKLLSESNRNRDELRIIEEIIKTAE